MEREDWRTASDEGLERLLGAARCDLPEEDFTAAVMKQVRRSARRRRLRVWVVGSALAIGVLVAFGPLVELARLAESLIRAYGWDGGALRAELVTQMHSTPVLAVLVCAFAWPVVARWVAR